MNSAVLNLFDKSKGVQHSEEKYFWAVQINSVES